MPYIDVWNIKCKSMVLFGQNKDKKGRYDENCLKLVRSVKNNRYLDA